MNWPLSGQNSVTAPRTQSITEAPEQDKESANDDKKGAAIL